MSHNIFDFDTRPDRRGSSCYKWDFDKRITGREGLLPFWVADMDFQAAPSILEALRTRADHGVFGYTARPESLDDALISWFGDRHRWNISQAQILEIPGVVPFVHLLVREYTLPGDPVIIQEPVYYPFRTAIENNGRRAVVNRLITDETGEWHMDLENLSRVMDESRAKLLILCSPHNPVGRVWTRSELLDLSDLCRSKGVTVVSDEIHADLVQPGFTHTPWLTLPEERLPVSLTLVSATKSFNIPGLNTAYAVVPGEDLRDKVQGMLTSSGIENGSSSPLSYAATEAAWRSGGSWLAALIDYIGKNDALLRADLSERLPVVESARLEGTYLEWLNLRNLGINDERAWERLLDAGVWLSRGAQFGQGGEGYMRMNIACPRIQLEEGLDKVVKALTR